MSLHRLVPALLLAAALPARGADLPADVFAHEPSLPECVFAGAPGDEVQDVIFFGEQRPEFLRFRVRAAGQGFRAAWREFAARLHRYLDGDGDGVLTAEESRRGNWQQLLQGQVFNANAGMNLLGSARPGLDADKDGKITTDELARYLRGALAFGEFGAAAGQAPDPRAQEAFGLLDRDRNGTLDRDELAALDDLVRRLDADEDELVELAEMRPDDNAYSNQFRGVNANASRYNNATALFLYLTPEDSQANARVARRLLSKYDTPGKDGSKDNALSRDEIDLDADAFRRADGDGDGKLTAAELEAFVRDPVPAVVFDVRLGRLGRGVAKVAAAKDDRGRALPLAEKVAEGRNGGLVVELQGICIEVQAQEAYGDQSQFYKQQFEAADSDKNGYLDKKEAQANFQINQFFAPADRDGDGKLFLAELNAYLDQQADATESRMVMTVTDRGRDLYDLLDANKDQKLGLRELRQARKRLAELDRDGDGAVGLPDVPHAYRLNIGRGQPPFFGGIVIQTYDSGIQPPASTGKGPAWFSRMDRNGDGDVSAREFLGPRDLFRRLDADGDGLLDAEEAGRTPRE